MIECGAPIQICAMRFTLLDDLGNVQDVADNSYVTNKGIEVQVSPEVEAGTSSILKGGCDDVLARYKGRDILLNWTFTFNRGALEPELVGLILGTQMFVDTGDVFGYALPGPSDEPSNVAFEMWMKYWVDGAQHPIWPWVHLTYPSTSWQLGDQTRGQDLQPEVMTGFSRTNLAWGQGPYGDGPGYDIRYGAIYLQQADPPTAACAAADVEPGS